MTRVRRRRATPRRSSKIAPHTRHPCLPDSSRPLSSAQPLLRVMQRHQLYQLCATRNPFHRAVEAQCMVLFQSSKLQMRLNGLHCQRRRPIG